MTSAFDSRIVRVSLEINGDITVLEGLDIRASGRKYASPINNECTVRISNLTEAQKNFILTKASPIINRKGGKRAVNLYLDVGRESYGTFRLFGGGVLATGATQPPDISITLQSINNNYATSLIGMNSFGAVVPLKTVAQKIADQNGLTLEYKVSTANNKNIGSYAFAGALAKQVLKLSEAGNVNAFVDNDKLVVIDINQIRSPKIIILNSDTGLVGVPQANEAGCIVQCLINNEIELCSGITVESKINPAVNGSYKILQINFELANRDTPFFYTLVCSNRPQDQGATAA